MKTYQAALFSEEKYRLGESPCFDARTGRLFWVDILDGKLCWLTADGRRGQLAFGQKLGAAVPLRDSDGFIAAGEKALYLVENGSFSPLRALSGEYAPYQRSNDAKADPAGRLWFGSVTDDMEHPMQGDLFCLDRGALKTMERGAKLPNGMAWNRAGTKFYFADSMDAAVYVYDYALQSGSISNKRLLFRIENGLPDGMCIDADDRLWVAVWGGRVEQRSGETGELLSEVRVPAERATSCCFCGKELDTLLITTFGEGLSGQYDGCLFTCRVDQKGLPTEPAVL